MSLRCNVCNHAVGGAKNHTHRVSDGRDRTASAPVISGFFFLCFKRNKLNKTKIQIHGTKRPSPPSSCFMFFCSLFTYIHIYIYISLYACIYRWLRMAPTLADMGDDVNVCVIFIIFGNWGNTHRHTRVVSDHFVRDSLARVVRGKRQARSMQSWHITATPLGVTNQITLKWFRRPGGWFHTRNRDAACVACRSRKYTPKK